MLSSSVADGHLLNACAVLLLANRLLGAEKQLGKHQQRDADVARLDVSEVAEDAFIAFQQAGSMLVSRTYFTAGQEPGGSSVAGRRRTGRPAPRQSPLPSDRAREMYRE